MAEIIWKVKDAKPVDIARLPRRKKALGNGAEQVRNAPPGTRNETLNREVFEAQTRGEPVEPYQEAARATGLGRAEVEATIQSAQEAAVRYTIDPTLEGLRKALEELAVEARFNMLNRSGEIAWDTGKWTPFDNRAEGALRNKLNTRFSFTGGKRTDFSDRAWRVVWDSLMFESSFNPLKDYWEKLPEWDRVPRLENVLHDLFGASGKLAKWASTFLFLGVIQRVKNPGCKLDEVPVLVGGQDFGKSALVRHVLPAHLRTLAGTGLNFMLRPKELVEAILNHVLIEVPDLGGQGHRQLEHTKAFVTKQSDDGVRLAYARHPSNLPRQCVFIATSNDPQVCPDDETGNRRWVVVSLKNGSQVEPWLKSNREQLWAEALAEHADGHRANLPRNLKAAQAQAAEDHRLRDALEDLVAMLEKRMTPLDAEGMTVIQVGDRINERRKNSYGINPTDRAEQMRLGKALRNRGWTRERVMIGGERAWRWVPPGGGAE